MTELDQIKEQDDFAILSQIKPEWMQAGIEPFVQNPQDDVEQPTWNKVKMDPTNYVTPGKSAAGADFVEGASVFNGLAWRANIAAQLISPF